jgi:hypothetical protein
MGNPWEHGLRSAVLAVGLAEAVGADTGTIEEAYFVSLLMYIGCTAETSVFAGFFGDELAARLLPPPRSGVARASFKRS